MIVLDEQLLGRGLEEPIRAWYPGKVCSVKELRPGTVIPVLLQRLFRHIQFDTKAKRMGTMLRITANGGAVFLAATDKVIR